VSIEERPLDQLRSLINGYQVTLVNPGGLERTTAEFADLLTAAGFRFVAAAPASNGWHVFEGVAE
jgi:hypothetical protein